MYQVQIKECFEIDVFVLDILVKNGLLCIEFFFRGGVIYELMYDCLIVLVFKLKVVYDVGEVDCLCKQLEVEE